MDDITRETPTARETTHATVTITTGIRSAAEVARQILFAD
jgi:hypothetical protein